MKRIAVMDRTKEHGSGGEGQGGAAVAEGVGQALAQQQGGRSAAQAAACVVARQGTPRTLRDSRPTP